MTTELFNVVQFFADETHEYVKRSVSAEEAVDVFASYTRSVGAKMGFVTRVVITDGGDFTNAEWTYGKGLTYPPREAA